MLTNANLSYIYINTYIYLYININTKNIILRGSALLYSARELLAGSVVGQSGFLTPHILHAMPSQVGLNTPLQFGAAKKRLF